MPIGTYAASDKRLKSVLRSDGKLYTIPRYQRGFSWKRSHYETLWNDILDDMKITTNGLFIGTILLNHGETLDDRVEVIDGQQRLLTITILLSSVRDALHKLEDFRTSAMVHERYIAEAEYAGEEEIPTILPGDKLRNYYKVNIQTLAKEHYLSEATTKEEKSVKSCKQFFDRSLRSEMKNYTGAVEKIKWLVSLLNTIEKITVVAIDVDQAEDAYAVFESVNAKGADLTLADILKNMIFRRIPPDSADDDYAQNQWDRIIENLDGTGFSMSKFIRYHWLSKYDFLTESKLYEAIKNKMDTEKAITWQEFLSNLVDDSRRLRNLVLPETHAYSEVHSPRKMTDALDAISSMGVTQCYVLLLSMHRNFSMKKKWEREVEFLEKFCFNYHAIGKFQAVRVEKRYSVYARRIESLRGLPKDDRAGKLEELLKELIQELQKLNIEFVTKEHFSTQFVTNIQYVKTGKKRHLLGYVLKKINNHLAGGTGELKIDPQQVNIEHVLPQKPELWELTTDDVKDYVNCIGNLTLLSKRLNSKAQNHPIKKKLKHLMGSELAITKDLVEFISDHGNKWDEDLINLRGQKIAELSFDEIWKIEY